MRARVPMRHSESALSTTARSPSSDAERRLRAGHTWPVGGAAASQRKRGRRALSDVLERIRDDAKEPLHGLYCGAGATLLSLLRKTAKLPAAVRIPALLDETACPLCGDDDAVNSFWWDGTPTFQERRLPRSADTTELACLVMSCLSMGAHEVVTAMSILESFVQTNGALFCPRSARPIFLACCILGCRLTTDVDVRTIECFDAVSNCFTHLTPLLVARVETQLLVLLDWSLPNDPAEYKKHAHALVEAGLSSGSKQTSILVPVLY